MSLTITVVDDQTGDTDTATVQDGDYIVVVAQPARLASVTGSDEGTTHTLVIEGRTP